MKLKIEKGQYDEQCMAVCYTSHFALMVKALNVGHQGRSTVYIIHRTNHGHLFSQLNFN